MRCPHTAGVTRARARSTQTSVNRAPAHWGLRHCHDRPLCALTAEVAAVRAHESLDIVSLQNFVATDRATTPIRGLGRVDPAGFRIIRDAGSTYRDGAEEAVLRIVSAAQDRTADSDEMIRDAVGWAQRYHVDPARANIVRCLDLPADARVLEIGAGCGAITRYLGENCRIVDALEPVPARAAVASARTQDLPGVEVIVGELADVPDIATYDVVVVVGVLEYMGRGSERRRPYLDFLDGIAARLVEGGTLILAIENALGVKYLAGAPEDHTDRVFDSIEGYPRGGRARTFSRRELEGLVRASGLTPETRVAFPDYKMTRAVLGSFPESTRSLLHRVPMFPSPDWRTARPQLADERSLWARLVAAGLETDFGNSFLVLATKGPTEGLWPPGRAGVFYSVNRRRELQVQTAIELDGDSVLFRRTRATAARDDDDFAGIQVTTSTMAYQPGVDLAHVLAEQGVAAFGEFADAWLGLLDDAIGAAAGSAVDVVPHNFVVDEDGGLDIIDLEFANCPGSREQIIRRGIYYLALRAAPLAPPERWAPARTVGDIMVQLGSLVGLPSDGSWIDPMIAGETDFLAAVRPLPRSDEGAQQWRTRNEARLRRTVARPLSSLPLGDRVPDQAARLKTEVAALRTHNQQLRKELAASKRKLKTAEKKRKQLASSPELRATRKLRRMAAKTLPRGTRRRAVVTRLAGRAVRRR